MAFRWVCVGIALGSFAASSCRSEVSEPGLVIRLERGGCSGGCPVYSVTAYGDGTVHYVGRSFVRVEGEVTFKLPASAVVALADELEARDYAGPGDRLMSMNCEQQIDAPSVSSQIVRHGVSTIGDYGGWCMREQLQAASALEARIDEALYTKQLAYRPDHD